MQKELRQNIVAKEVMKDILLMNCSSHGIYHLMKCDDSVLRILIIVQLLCMKTLSIDKGT